MRTPVVTLDSQTRRDARRRLWRQYVHTDTPQVTRELPVTRVRAIPVVRPASPGVIRKPLPREGNPLPWLVVSMLALEVLGLLLVVR
jgi:hypothetical protein